VPIIDCYTLLGAWPQAETDLSVENLAAGMQARGVGRCLVTHATAIFYDAGLGNEQAVRLCAEHDPLTPVAVVNPLDYPTCVEEIDRRFDGGSRIFRLCPVEHGYPFSAQVGPLCAVLEKLAGAKLLLVDLRDAPAPVIGSDLIDRLPVPTAFSVDSTRLGTLLHAGKQSPKVWVDTSGLESGGAVECAVTHLGVQRVVFGSRAPLFSLGSAVMSVQYAELAEADRQAIFEGNLQQLLG
jgi:predicted TIM-barrel fold metal-dependent hydrolase